MSTKWLSVRLRPKWLWLRILLLSLNAKYPYEAKYQFLIDKRKSMDFLCMAF